MKVIKYLLLFYKPFLILVEYLEEYLNNINPNTILIFVLYEEKLPIYFLEALYDGKSVTLNGVTNAPSSIEKVSNIAKEITGCDEVHSNIYIASDIPMTHEV